MRLILASQSPRRRQLMEEAGYAFEIILPRDGAETPPQVAEMPRDVVLRLGRDKAADVASRVESGIVIGCDTVADCDGVVLGKPSDREDARKMLEKLNGRQHSVHSGLCLWRRPENEVFVGAASTTLAMKELTQQQIHDYLDSQLWVGKAGGFGLQDRTGWIECVDGSESNVVGLPMELLRTALADMMGDRHGA